MQSSSRSNEKKVIYCTTVNRHNIKNCCRLCLKSDGLEMREILFSDHIKNSYPHPQINTTSIFLTLNIKVSNHDVTTKICVLCVNKIISLNTFRINCTKADEFLKKNFNNPPIEYVDVTTKFEESFSKSPERQQRSPTTVSEIIKPKIIIPTQNLNLKAFLSPDNKLVENDIKRKTVTTDKQDIFDKSLVNPPIESSAETEEQIIANKTIKPKTIMPTQNLMVSLVSPDNQLLKNNIKTKILTTDQDNLTIFDKSLVNPAEIDVPVSHIMRINEILKQKQTISKKNLIPIIVTKIKKPKTITPTQNLNVKPPIKRPLSPNTELSEINNVKRKIITTEQEILSIFDKSPVNDAVEIVPSAMPQDAWSIFNKLPKDIKIKIGSKFSAKVNGRPDPMDSKTNQKPEENKVDVDEITYDDNSLDSISSDDFWNDKKWLVLDKANKDKPTPPCLTLERKRKRFVDLIPRLCPICGILAKEIQRHIDKHSNPQFTCDICGKSYRMKKYLKQHIFSHVYGRHKCPICAKEFHVKSILKRHIKQIHDANRSRLYPCSLCPHRAYTKNHLKKHQIVHTGERKFSCAYCTAKCASKESLRYHTKTFHELLTIPDPDYFVTIKSDDMPSKVLETVNSAAKECAVAVEKILDTPLL